MGRLRPRFKSHEQSRKKRSPADLYDAALRHFLSKRVGPAEDRCREALTLDPKHADSLHLLGLVHWQTKAGFGHAHPVRETQDSGVGKQVWPRPNDRVEADGCRVAAGNDAA